MSKLLLAITGAGDTGKSTTAVNIAQKLKKLATSVDVWEDDVNGVDAYAEMTFGKKRLVLLSQGDPGTGMEDALEKAVDDGFDIIICTCRIYGATLEAVQSHFEDYDNYYLRSASGDSSFDFPISKKNVEIGVKLVELYI